MAVEEESGRSCFVNQSLHHSADDADPMTRQQEDHLKLLYSKEVEFAIGHGSHATGMWIQSTSGSLVEMDRPTAPYEVRKSQTVPIQGVESRMTVLGTVREKNSGECCSLVVTEYEKWITAETAKLQRS